MSSCAALTLMRASTAMVKERIIMMLRVSNQEELVVLWTRCKAWSNCNRERVREDGFDLGAVGWNAIPNQDESNWELSDRASAKKGRQSTLMVEMAQNVSLPSFFWVVVERRHWKRTKWGIPESENSAIEFKHKIVFCRLWFVLNVLQQNVIYWPNFC